MSSTDRGLLVIVPARSRPEAIGRVVAAWDVTEAWARAELLFAVDEDDPRAPEYARTITEHMNNRRGEGISVHWSPQWQPMVHKLNEVARLVATTMPRFRAIGFAGDDHLPRTRGWAGAYLTQLDSLGTGIVFCDDGFQHDKLPTQWAMTADIVRALDAMVPSRVEHLYCDNVVKELGWAARCLAYLPEHLIEHMHPVAGKGTVDEQYQRVNANPQYEADRRAYRDWLTGERDADVDKIRRLNTVAVKNKVGRNGRIAAPADVDEPDALYNFARSQLDAGHPIAAIDACRSGLAAHPEAIVRVGLLTILIRSLVAMNRLSEANEALAELREAARKEPTVDQAEVILRAAQGNHERVLEILRDLPKTAVNDLGVAVGRQDMTSYEINSLMATGQPAEAAEILRAALRAGRLVVPLGMIVQVLEDAGSDVSELARLIPEDAVREVLYGTGTVSAAIADAVVEALWQRFPGDPQLFGVVVWLADQLPLDRAIEWSGRLREQGLAKYCPLLATAASTNRSAGERALAAAAALEVYGDQDALTPLADALDHVPDEQTREVLNELHVRAPGVASAIELV